MTRTQPGSVFCGGMRAIMVWVVAEDYYRSSYSSSLCFGLLFRGEEKVHKNQKDSGRRMG